MTVSWSAIDALSDVAAVSGLVTVTTEGGGQVVPGSATDLAGNIATGSVTINLDKTPPEAFFQFDPIVHDVVLLGRDSPSGVPPGPIAPISVVPSGDGDGDDVRKELCTYQVLDLAGIRKNHHHISIMVVSLQYGEGAVINLSRNLQSFEWSLRDDGGLKELEQDSKAGPGEESQRVDADFDLHDNKTTIVQMEPEPRTKTVKSELDLLRMATSGGKLLIEF